MEEYSEKMIDAYLEKELTTYMYDVLVGEFSRLMYITSDKSFALNRAGELAAAATKVKRETVKHVIENDYKDASISVITEVIRLLLPTEINVRQRWDKTIVDAPPDHVSCNDTEKKDKE